MALPGKLIIAIITIVILFTFIGFNWSYTSDVSVVFHEFENVPIVITIGISFVAGALFAIPYAVASTLRHKKKQKERIEHKQQQIQKAETRRRTKEEKSSARKKTGANKNTATPLPDVPPNDSVEK